MPTYTQYLKKHYPNKETTTEIILDSRIEGIITDILDLTGYNNLTKLEIVANNIVNGSYNYVLGSAGIANKAKIVKLGFWNNQITEPNFKYLADNYPNLEFLSFSKNQISKDANFKDLARLTKLKELYINDNNKDFLLNVLSNLPPSLTTYNTEPTINNPAVAINNENNSLKVKIVELEKRPNITTKEYDDLKLNQEKHTDKDLKPVDLPDNWKTELARIPDLEKRPTQDDLNIAVQAETDKYKGWVDPTTYRNDWINPIDFDKEAKAKGYKTQAEYDARPDVTVEEYNRIKNNQKPDDLPSNWKEQLDKIPTLESNQKPADYDTVKESLKEWTDAFSNNEKPSDVINQINDLKDRPDIPITKEKWETDYKNRPTKTDLDTAVEAEKSKYQGFIDPNNKAVLEAEAKKNGMVSKDDLDSVKNQVQDYKDNLKNKLGLDDSNLDTWKDKIDKLKWERDDLEKKQEKHTEKDLEKHKPEDLKPANLPSNWEKYLEEYLESTRKKVKKELTKYYQRVETDDDTIKEKFESDEEWKRKYGADFNDEFDYENIVDKKLTLDNRNDMEGSFKVIACICATEMIEEWFTQISSPTTKVLETIEKVWKEWENITKNHEQISEKNNPFYLNIIDKQEEKKKEIQDLVNKYKNELQALQVQLTK